LPVQGGDGVDGVAQVAVCAVEEQDGEFPIWVRNPPAGELGFASFGDGELDGFIGNAVAGRGAGDGCYGVVEKLPTALPEEQAEGEPRAGEGGEDCDSRGAG